MASLCFWRASGTTRSGHPRPDGKPHAASRDAGPASRAAIIQSGVS
jgi:hypothetical protein